MSLTGELDKRNSPINHWFDERLPNVAPVSKEWYAQVKPVLVRRPETDRRVPSTVGTAFDYRVRYYFATTPLEEMVAATGMRLLDLSRARTRTTRAAPDAFLDLYGPPPADAAAAAALLEPFRDALAEVLVHLAPVRRTLSPVDEDELCRYCYVLGWFEELYRAGLAIRSPLFTLTHGATVADLLALPDQLWIGDICQLSAAFAVSLPELDGERVVLNPIFAGSGDIGGADADLIIDGCLIDIKTTIDPKFSKRRLLYQLLGYALLDYNDEFAIDAVGVYLSRQALFVRFELQPLLMTLVDAHRVSLPDLRESFREAVLSTQF
jgi:hypothetical protein